MALIDIIAGARPNFMKIAPIIRALESRVNNRCELRYRLIHTGQHYDKRMSEDFFSQLGIPEPCANLEVGSGTQAEQTAAIMIRYESINLTSRSDLCLVVGDVTSTMACAITAQKLKIPVAHVEAGIRSGDWSMPEEINRMATDAITNYFFTTSESANQNLARSGVPQERIYFVGNTMIDTLISNLPRITPPRFWNQYELKEKNFITITLHRPSNVDDPEQLKKLLSIISENAQNSKLIFPVHPRTKKTLSHIQGLPENIYFVDPQPYLEFIFLVKNAKAIITDSGGITEEATVLGVPCMTLRDSTERPETVEQGTNELLGTNPSNLISALETLFNNEWKTGSTPAKWDGNTGERIVGHLKDILSEQAI